MIGICDICRYGQTGKCINPDRDYPRECFVSHSGTTIAEKQIRADAIEEYTDWLFNEGYIGLHWNNPTNAIQNLLNKYKEQMQKGVENEE